MIKHKLLIAVSTKFEIQDFLDKHCTQIKPDYFQLNNNINIAVLITGIGIANTCLNLSRFLSEYKVGKAINIGFCGAFSEKHKYGSLLKIEQDCFAELGVYNEKHEIESFEMLNTRKNIFENLNMHVEAKKETDLDFGKIIAVNGVTVNSCTNNAKRASFMIENFNAEAESMEGAAFFLCCNAFDIPCSQIRAVSNHIPGHTPENWNIEAAKEQIFKFLSSLK